MIDGESGTDGNSPPPTKHGHNMLTALRDAITGHPWWLGY
jgi:hypothetical protein